MASHNESSVQPGGSSAAETNGVEKRHNSATTSQGGNTNGDAHVASDTDLRYEAAQADGNVAAVNDRELSPTSSTGASSTQRNFSDFRETAVSRPSSSGRRRMELVTEWSQGPTFTSSDATAEARQSREQNISSIVGSQTIQSVADTVSDGNDHSPVYVQELPDEDFRAPE